MPVPIGHGLLSFTEFVSFSFVIFYDKGALPPPPDKQVCLHTSWPHHIYMYWGYNITLELRDESTFMAVTRNWSLEDLYLGLISY